MDKFELILDQIRKLEKSVQVALAERPAIIVVNRSDMSPEALAKAIHKAFRGKMGL